MLDLERGTDELLLLNGRKARETAALQMKKARRKVKSVGRRSHYISLPCSCLEHTLDIKIR